jgi:hypothetical protein
LKSRQLGRGQPPLINCSLPSIRESHSSLPAWEVFCVARDEQTVLADRARPNDRVGQLEPVFLPQLNRFLRYLCRQCHNAKMSKEFPTYILIRMCSRASHHLHPRNDADAAVAIARDFLSRRSVAVQKIEQNVAVQQRVQLRKSSRAALRRLHSPRRAATWREILPRDLDAPKNEPRSLAGDTRRYRATARRIASAREILSRRQNNLSFLICSSGRSTIVRTMISSHVIISGQEQPQIIDSDQRASIKKTDVPSLPARRDISCAAECVCARDPSPMTNPVKIEPALYFSLNQVANKTGFGSSLGRSPTP